MNKKNQLLFFFLMVASMVHAQSLHLKNLYSQADITGDTVEVQSVYNNGWVGYESLDIFVLVENTSGNTLEVGAKKIELTTLQPDVLHTICFAGNCYNTTTFVSPAHAILDSSETDSSFSGHYLFDNSVHVRGVDYVAYVFYDELNPSDSAVVYVKYNSVISNVGIAEQKNTSLLFSDASPNPANDFVVFNRNASTKNAAVTVVLKNSSGESVTVTKLFCGKEKIFINTSSLLPGIYYCSFFTDSHLLETKKIVVCR